MKTALIDGDIFIYKAACAAEKEYRWPDGEWTYHATEEDAIEIIRDKFQDIMDNVKPKDYLICFSDSINNFRKNIYPEYKSNRKDTRKPLLLKMLRLYCETEFNTVDYPNLEADDVLGILATSPDIEGEKVIVTIDKDLAQIPVTIYNPDTKKFSKPEHRDYENMVLLQTLTGDAVDGYPGCPGMGDTTAQELLDEPFLWEQYDHTFKSGKRKGLMETRWRKGEPCSPWEAIVSAYEKQGLTEADALVQARCAYILQHHNYNVDGSINLWEPDHGSQGNNTQTSSKSVAV